MNIYRHKFAAECPNNGALITYELEIQTNSVILVEAITAATEKERKGLHEEIADRLHKSLGGRQILKAHHHGVDIETRRDEPVRTESPSDRGIEKGGKFAGYTDSDWALRAAC